MKNIRTTAVFKHLGRSVSYISLYLIVSLFFSCEEFVEVELPDSQLTGEAVFEDASTANAAIADIYARLRDDAFITGGASGIGNLMGHYADELTYYSSNQLPEQDFYNNNLTAVHSIIDSWWSSAYHLIYACNSILEGVANSTALTAEEKSQLSGEALFLRAYIHFYLVNLFGDVPYIKTTDYRVNMEVGRIPESQVYEQIILDLEAAEEALAEEYFGSERIRVNQHVASAFLARVYLYNNMWQLAEEKASAVIEEGMFIWEADLDQVFKKSSGGLIWQLKPGIPGNNTQDAFNYIFEEGPPPVSALNMELIHSFEAGDARLSHWTRAVTNGSETWYHAYKYKLNSNTGTSEEYSILFRLAEQYLIRAEARVHLGDLGGAAQDLNKVRIRANLPETTAESATELLVAIAHERQVELFTELGHRWFDLKRSGSADEVLFDIKAGWEDTDVLLPLPETELLLNENLQPQNAGY